jgi:hypothetical protein
MAEQIGTIISSAGKTMIELLKSQAGFADGDIVMKSPVDAGTSAKVALFLFQVHENPYLRNAEQQEVGTDALRPPPLPLDLFYLVTPLSQDPDTALGHLESVMRVFYDHPVLQPPLLPPSMVAAGNEAVRITPHVLSLEDTNRLWAMFPSKPFSLSVTYLVSPVQVPSARVVPVTRVREKVTRFVRTGGSQ